MECLATLNWNAVLPGMAVLVTALVLLVLSRVFRLRGGNPKAASTAGIWVSLTGLGLAAWMSALQWDTLSAAFGGMLLIDPFSTFLSLLILGGAVLTVLISRREAAALGQAAGEYYALIALAALGMLVLVSAGDLKIGRAHV
mgnify:CR=1 FL=1